MAASGNIETFNEPPPVDDTPLENKAANENVQIDIKTNDTICDKILTVRVKRLSLADINKKGASLSVINISSIAHDPFKAPNMVGKQNWNTRNFLRNGTILEPIHEEQSASSLLSQADRNTILNESSNRREFLNSIADITRSLAVYKKKKKSIKELF